MSRVKQGPDVLAATPADAGNREQWVTRRHAARLLGVDQRTATKVAVAALIRTKKLPGVLGVRYFLPDIQRIAREAVGNDRETGTARPR
jgi:hypothetical protein